MKKINFCLIVLFLTGSVYSQDVHKIKQIIFYYNTTVPALQNRTSNGNDIKNVSADSIEVYKLNSMISKIKPKSTPIYKPAAGYLEGLMILDNEEEINFKLSYNALFINQGKHRHYLFKNREDLDWIKELINRYHKKLEDVE